MAGNADRIATKAFDAIVTALGLDIDQRTRTQVLKIHALWSLRRCSHNSLYITRCNPLAISCCLYLVIGAAQESPMGSSTGQNTPFWVSTHSQLPDSVQIRRHPGATPRITDVRVQSVWI